MKTVVWIAQQKRNSLHSYHSRNHKLLFRWQAFSAIYIINTTEYKFTIKLIIVWNFMPFFHFQYTAHGHKRPDLDRDSTFSADNCHSSVDMEIQVFHHLIALWTKSMQSWNAARKVEIEKCKPISKSFTSFMWSSRSANIQSKRCNSARLTRFMKTYVSPNTWAITTTIDNYYLVEILCLPC